MKKLLIVGAGGFGREMHAWALQHPDHGRDWIFAGFLDDNPAALADFAAFAPVRPLTGHRPAADDRHRRRRAGRFRDGQPPRHRRP
ncbi:hypothetical protein EBR16_04155 [bacterium]|nr:hypothetical protein [bacterium]